jgi:hypothetical protein
MRWNCQELKHIIFRSALALSSALIHVLAHFQRTTCSQIYFRFSSYLTEIYISLASCVYWITLVWCVKHNFKSVHVSNLFWSREYPSFSKVGGNYPLDLNIIWSSMIFRSIKQYSKWYFELPPIFTVIYIIMLWDNILLMCMWRQNM